jgi:hypothetical protein
MDFNTCEIIQEGGKYEKKHEPPVPTGIKEIAGNKQQDVLQTQIALCCKPIEEENSGQEKRKANRVKKHNILKPRVNHW